MKKILYSIIMVVSIFSSCIKPPLDPTAGPILPVCPTSYLDNVKAFILEYIATGAYDSIDFSKYHISKQTVDWYIRIALKNKLFSKDFIIVKTDSLGNGLAAKYIHLEKASATAAKNGVAAANKRSISSYTGFIDMSTLDRKTILHSAIISGYIEAWHPELFAADTKIKGNAREESFPVPYDELPEVVVVGYAPYHEEVLSYSDYISLQVIMDGSGNPTTNGYTNGGNGNGNSGSNGYTSGGSNAGVYSPVNNNGDGGTANNQDITIGFDESVYRPAIDLDAWLKCFTNIPDAGASCSVTLYGDLPDDANPGVGINLFTGNTGHCFLQLKKNNGAQSVTQYIGFTAQSASKAILNTYAFVPGKTVDNAGHKYNCSISMDLTAFGLNTVLNKMKALDGRPYSVVNYDCLDYALEVVNTVRPGNPLVVQKVYEPGDAFSDIATGPKLYNLLQGMIDNGSPEASHITVAGANYAGVSHGACN